MSGQSNILSNQKKELDETEYKHRDLAVALEKPGSDYQRFFNAVPIGLGITSIQGNILNTNKMLQDLLGYTQEELASMSVSDVFVDPDADEKIRQAMSNNSHLRNIEAKLKNKNGTLITVLINSDEIIFDDEKITLTSIQDITSLKKMQEELQDSEERYYFLFNSAPVGITVTDFQGKIFASNQAMQELLEYTEDELKIIKTFDFYYNSFDRKRLLDLTKETGVVRDFEAKYKRKDGRIRTVLINTDIISYKGQDGLLLTSIRDITSQKQVEEKVKKERDFTNAILDTTASLVLVLNREGVVSVFNRSCEKLSGYSSQEAIGRKLEDIISANPVFVEQELRKLFSGQYPTCFESLWVTRSGEKRLISWINTVLLNDKKDKVEYVVATGIDITEQRQAEKEVEEVNQQLTVWIKELETRTEELNQMREMSEQLQNCQTVEEACSISAQYIKMICPNSCGNLYMINPNKDLAEEGGMWGNYTFSEKIFAPLDCWAIRRGQPHIIDHSHPELRCGHINGPQDRRYLCVPMIAHGETIGVLHLNQVDQALISQDQQTIQNKECTIQLIMTIANHVALALSNLKMWETIRQQSIRDPLTGLFNRRYMEESLTRELHRAEREKKSVGIIMFDIDHFKEFNDTFGHDGGDALLHELGEFLLKGTRVEDIVTRYGGEEFVAVFPNSTLEDTGRFAEKLRLGIRKLLVYHMGQPLRECTISLGVAAYPQHGLTGKELLRAADKALYQAKNKGKNRVVIAPVISNNEDKNEDNLGHVLL